MSGSSIRVLHAANNPANNNQQEPEMQKKQNWFSILVANKWECQNEPEAELNLCLTKKIATYTLRKQFLP